MSNKTGIWIPIEIIEETSLDWIDKVLLTEIISLSELELGCIASNETFAKFLNLHKGNISKRITSLVERGFIKIKLIKKGEKRTMRIIIPQLGVSGYATRSKRIRTEEYADTQLGVSGNAPRSERERLPTNTDTNKDINSNTSSVINSVINLEEEQLNRTLEKLNIK